MDAIALVLVMIGTSLVSGTVAGLLGVGGGIVVVPMLEYAVRLTDVPSDLRMHVAVATPMATIVRDNRAAMLRAVSAANSAASRIENRIGEPAAANPYLYVTSEILSGLDGVENAYPPPDMTSASYETEGRRLPRHLLAAVDAFDASDFYRRALGADFVDYLCTVKRAELDRFFQDATDWEHAEYFDLF